MAVTVRGVTSIHGKTADDAGNVTLTADEFGLGSAATKDVTIGTYDPTAGRLLKLGDYGIGASPLGGQIRSWVLPPFIFGEGGVTDEYLVLFPSAAAGPHGIIGEFRMSRGSSATANTPTVEEITAQSAYASNVLRLSHKDTSRFKYFSLLDISGVQYVALKGDVTGGSCHNLGAFYGTVVGGDAKLFTRVRASDANVTVVTEVLTDAVKDYHSGNVVGSVSSGAVIESGSNANGSYTQYADGTMICTTNTLTVNSGAYIWTFPKTFTVPPAIFGTERGNSLTTVIIAVKFNGVTQTIAPTYSIAYDVGGVRQIASGVSLSAIGRWK